MAPGRAGPRLAVPSVRCEPRKATLWVTTTFGSGKISSRPWAVGEVTPAALRGVHGAARRPGDRAVDAVGRAISRGLGCSGAMAEQLNELQFVLGEVPCVEVVQTSLPVKVADLRGPGSTASSVPSTGLRSLGRRRARRSELRGHPAHDPAVGVAPPINQWRSPGVRGWWPKRRRGSSLR